MKTLVGLDLVECARFTQWPNFSDKALLKIFSLEEIAYCRTEPLHSATRFAVRFAAREALYKALSSLQHNPSTPMPFFAFCRSIKVIKSPQGAPNLELNYDALATFYAVNEIVHVSLSLSHTAITAGAVVIVTIQTAK